MTDSTISALQRRLMVAESRPDEPWLILAENVPQWPSGCRPRSRSLSAGHEPYTYAPSRGSVELRTAIVERERRLAAHPEAIDQNNVLVTAGGMHAVGLLARDCFERGYRTVVCPVPVFRGVYDTFIAAGFEVQTVRLSDTGQTRRTLERSCDERTVLYINLPHNPTGLAPSPTFLTCLAEIVEASGAFLVYDAVYDSFCFDPMACSAPVSLAVGPRPAVVLNSMSKNYGRPGDRIGWILADQDTIGRLVARLEWDVVAINGAAQLAAAEVIAGGNDALVAAVARGRAAYRRHTEGHPFLDVPVPPSGTQLWLKLPVPDVERFADFALHEYAVVLTTSANYVPIEPGYIRFPTGLDADLIRRGVDALSAAVDAWSRESTRHLSPVAPKALLEC